jgi:hypothetical protein
MLPLLIDENFNHRILRGLRLRVPALDVVIVQETACKDCKTRRCCEKPQACSGGGSDPGRITA